MHTGGREFFAATFNFDDPFPAQSILGAARKKATCNILVHFFLIANQITRVRSRVDRWMRLIVPLASPWWCETPVLETTHPESDEGMKMRL